MRLVLAWIALTTAALAQRQEPGVPPGWTVYVVHASWCAPCQRFRRDYDTIAEFRGPLESAFAVKSCDWERPNEQRWSRRFGASSLPSFIVFRDGRHYTTFAGYDGNWRAFLERLNIDIETPAGDRAGENSGLTEQEPRRPITPQERAIPEIADLQSELSKLRAQLRSIERPPESSPAAPSAAAPAVISPPPQEETSTKTAGSGIVGPSGSASSFGGSWGAVAETLGAAALTVLAPQVALPAGAIGAAVSVAQYLRRRKQAADATRLQQQPQHTWTVERPVVVSTDCPPPPAQVVTQNQYVPVERDTHQEAWAWASREYAHKYPGSEGMIQALDHLMGQYNSAKQKAA